MTRDDSPATSRRPDDDPIILEALASAACTRALDITREALAVLGLPAPFTEADVDAAMAGLTPEQEAALGASNRRYFDEA
ncbi:MAG: hypothetical protein L0Y64_26370, partial [Myxococcaceae bacterium]|nr:hypothetical protein [Myxococcaceae bacterium]